MGVPTSEVGYTIATTRKETTKVHKNMWWHGGGEVWVEFLFTFLSVHASRFLLFFVNILQILHNICTVVVTQYKSRNDMNLHEVIKTYGKKRKMNRRSRLKKCLYRCADKSLAWPWKETSYSDQDLKHYTKTYGVQTTGIYCCCLYYSGTAVYLYRGADKSLARPWKETSYSDQDQVIFYIF